MAAFNFPNSPITGQIHNENGVGFIWDGTKWKKKGGLTDGDYGDITVSNAGGTFTIDTNTIDQNKLTVNSVGSPQIIDGQVGSGELAQNAVLTDKIADKQVDYSKIQDVSASNRVLGRDSSGAGTIEEIAPADLRTMINVEDGATADQTGSEIKALYEAEANTNAYTDAEQTKLAAIEHGADVTSGNSIGALNDVDLTAVADGKILKYQASLNSFVIADDTGGGGGSGGGGASNFTALSDTPISFTGAAGQKLQVNSTSDGIEFVDVDTDLAQDSTPQLSADLDVQTNKITTSTTDGNVQVEPNGTGVFEIRGAGGNDGTLQLNCSAQSHGVKIKSPPHSAGASYTLTLPDDTGTSNQVLKTDGTGSLSWVDQTTDTDTTYTAGSGLTLTGTEFSVDTLNQDTTGTSGGFTAGNASNLDSGTIPDDRFPATLPTANGSNLTDLTSANLTGALPALDGSALTNMPGGLVGGGGEELFVEATNAMNTDFTTTAGNNYISATPITIGSGVTLTVTAGSVMTFV